MKDTSELNAKMWSYSVGFVLSIALTIAAYLLVTKNVFGGWTLGYAVLALAVVQFFVQMVFFLHAGKGPDRRWNLLVLALMIIIVSIIVIGSLWIMHNLNYRMTPQQMLQYLKDQDGGI